MSSPKRLVIFDLDGTLSVSKSVMDGDMARLLDALLARTRVAVISGGAFHQFERQFLPPLGSPVQHLTRLFLFPTNGAQFMRYQDGGWREIYAECLSEQERAHIRAMFAEAFETTQYRHPPGVCGEVIEDRGTQVTFSALGQQASPQAKSALKARWRDTGDPRLAIAEYIAPRLPNLDVHLNGMTSIDITRKGVNKAYGVRQMEACLGVPKCDMLFIGDAIFPGGNDYSVKTEGVDCIAIDSVEETKAVIGGLIDRVAI